MKIIYFSSYYDKYIVSFLKKNSDFKFLSYKEQIQRVKADYFGVFCSYTDHANKHGNDASLIIPNFEVIQKKWAAENNFKYNENNWMKEIAVEQIRTIRPDAFYISSMFNFYGDFIKQIKPYCKAIYCWIACPIPKGIDLSPIDLVLTSVPEYVQNFRSLNINSELLPAAFDTNILKLGLDKQKRDIDFSFVGGFSDAHQKRKELIDGLIKHTPLTLYGYGVEMPRTILGKLKRLYDSNSIQNRYKGEAWGTSMYELLGRSKITFNVHIDMALGNRVNMRMYEATGIGTMLLSDKSKNSTLNYFKDGEEVVEYDSLEDAIEKYKYYISHDKEREAIAKKGQLRTCTDYNYDKNSLMMIDYFKKYLK